MSCGSANQSMLANVGGLNEQMTGAVNGVLRQAAYGYTGQQGGMRRRKRRTVKRIMKRHKKSSRAKKSRRSMRRRR
jgi:hypothetical protein